MIWSTLKSLLESLQSTMLYSNISYSKGILDSINPNPGGYRAGKKFPNI